MPDTPRATVARRALRQIAHQRAPARETAQRALDQMGQVRDTHPEPERPVFREWVWVVLVMVGLATILLATENNEETTVRGALVIVGGMLVCTALIAMVLRERR